MSTSRKTAGPGRGRFASDCKPNEELEALNVTIPRQVRMILRRIGKGNMSRGVRQAARSCAAQNYKGD